MQEQLGSLTKDFTSTAASAQRTLRGLFGGGAERKPPPSPVPDLDAVPTGKLRPGYGSQPARGGGGTGTGSQLEMATPPGTGSRSFRLPGTGSRGVKAAAGAGSRGSGSAKAKARNAADGAALHRSCALCRIRP